MKKDKLYYCLCFFFLLRNGKPVHPVNRTTPSPASTGSTPRTKSEPSRTPSPGGPLTKSPPAAQETVQRSGDEKASKPSVMGELDFDLGDVSEDESWEVSIEVIRRNVITNPKSFPISKKIRYPKCDIQNIVMRNPKHFIFLTYKHITQQVLISKLCSFFF